jgi:lipoic acid synthetase
LSKKTNTANIEQNISLHRPEWLKVRLGHNSNISEVRSLVRQKKLNTVCESARCPNIGECWSRRTATFMILGNICTRSCKFCNIEVKKPYKIEIAEPSRVAEAVNNLNLRHAVITSVARDDLPDGGASVFAETIKRIRDINPNCSIEVLIPDFKGDVSNLNTVLDANPNILNHNLETVERLQRPVRVQATYERSLFVLEYAGKKGYTTKSGIMVGLGEHKHEIYQTLTDLRAIECNILTIGQYLPPTKQHYPLSRYYHPDEFLEIKKKALELGFTHIEAGPLVRSSYHADEQLNQ